MLISTNPINELVKRSEKERECYCNGLYLSARWFTVSQYDYDGIQMIVLPDKEAAEYCAADLYNLIEGDRVFFLPDSGKSLERSNYKSSLGVQRTSAIGKVIACNNFSDSRCSLILVTYPSALAEKIPSVKSITDSV